MAPPLRLTITDYIDATRWRWVLSDGSGLFLADHSVQLDPTSREYNGLLDLHTYLDYNQPISAHGAQLAVLGKWMGDKLFGGLLPTLWQRRAAPAAAVHVVLPAAAHTLVRYPFELACFSNGKSLPEAGVRFIYDLAGSPAEQKAPSAEALRILAVFSLPVRANPLNLRRERYGLQRLVGELVRTQGRAVELRVLQYGATRKTLDEALQKSGGWDIIHLSGHGNQGELLLEDERGGDDTIDAEELGDLLDLTRSRLKLLILDACYTGAGSHAAARALVGLDSEPQRTDAAADTASVETAQTPLPGLAQALSQRLDCATLAMRYPVGDAFATDLMLALYGKLLDKGQPLPAALHLALRDTLRDDTPKSPLSPATPILVGQRAAAVQLEPPRRTASFTLPSVGLEIGFPAEREHFVGRMQPMLRASQALAPQSQQRGVLFYGMPGAGKTSCALELAYRHEEGRFGGYVWYDAPQQGSDISSALFGLMQAIQTQLNKPDLGLTTALNEPEQFRRFTLPRLRAMLQEEALLLVLDNMETLLTESGGWRDPLWGEVVAALLAHNGQSRLVLTSRRVPADLAHHPQLLVEAIHALSFAESVLLARELPNLKGLFRDDEGLKLLRETLRVAQGNPKLLEFANSLAADRAALRERVQAAASELADRADLLDTFFALGIQREGETRQSEGDFVRALQSWTAGLTGHLAPTARLLFAFLCRLEPEDRRHDIVQANWKDFLTRLGPEHPTAVAALAEPEQGLPPALAALEATSLLEVHRQLDQKQREQVAQLLAQQVAQGELDPAAVPTVLAMFEAESTSYTIHPGVAETVRASSDGATLAAADIELGNHHIAMFRHGLKQEMQGGGSIITTSARRAAPYLMRQMRWDEAGTLLERLLQRDRSPDSLTFAVPLLRRIADESARVEAQVVLARTLRQMGRTAEAERMLRDLITQAVAQNNYRLASVLAGDLLNLLKSSGHLPEALVVADRMIGYTQQAGLGPWTQLADEVRRLQVLAAMGQYDAVLDAVETLRPQIASLPLVSEAEETVNPWNVREGLLDTGRTAALYTERWETALTLNAEVVEVTQARGADALELARTRFNDYGPLLRLNRYTKARSLLLACRAVFEAERDIERLGRVYGALADLEDKTGGQDAAASFQKVALAYTYQAGQPEDCAASHHNLANYLERQHGDPSTVLAHRLTAATIRLQTQSGLLPSIIRNLAISDLPPAPPTFASVADCVEAIEGVRFRTLFERLPRTHPDGDAAIAAVWRMVLEEKARREVARQQQEAMQATLASLPADIQAAFALDGDEFSAALRAALERLPAEEAEAMLERMREADLIG